MKALEMNAHELKKQIRDIDEALRRNSAALAHSSSGYSPEVAVEAYRIVGVASRLRLDNSGENAAWQVWERAIAQMRVANTKRYPEGFEAGLEALRHGDSSCAEPVIHYLEADPWFPGSGYAKEKAIHRLKRGALTEAQMTRLRTVILRVVGDSGGRREWTNYARLAKSVDSPELRRDIVALTRSFDGGTRRRAQWILDVLEGLDPKRRHLSYYLDEGRKFLARWNASHR